MDEEYKLARIEYAKRSKYIDLKTNGRLFPSWILANFKRYKLPEIVSGQDPCNEKTDEKDAKNKLREYQLFLSKYLDYKSPYRDILIYHGLGSGKTASTINIYNMLYNYTPGWNVFILLKASLRANWLGEIKKWLKKDEYEYRFKNIIFIHYDSPFADRDFMDATRNVDSSKKSIYIIEEVHNFIRNVYSNVSSTKGKRAQIIYDYIIQDKQDNPDTRVVLLSGTPAINTPFEIALLFNLLRPNIFPKSENEFNSIFVDSTIHKTIKKGTKNMFQRRIMGLVSYYLGATPDYFASKTIIPVNVEMSRYQIDIYNYYEDIERKIALRMREGKGSGQDYKSLTRQACNFVFPQISQKINGEGRPRPSRFRISEREAEKLNEGRKVQTATLTNIDKYKASLEYYIEGLKQYYNEKAAADKKAGHTILDDVRIFEEKYKKNFDQFNKEETKKSQLYKAIHDSSAKMLNIIFNIMISPGPTIVYSNYVLMEGLEIFKVILDYFNFYPFMKTKEYLPNKIGYTEFHGGIKDMKERTFGMDAYNREENRYGKYIKIMLISPAGAEGLSLFNVRQIHIMEPYWNEVRIEQMIGRGIRQCGHKLLKMDERHVDIYRYRSVRPGKWTTDQYIEDLAKTKSSLLQSFLDAIKEAAIDCELFKNHNMLADRYNCFQFDETTLFDKYIGPAYKEDLYDDMKINSGSNSTTSITKKVKVIKIKAVIQLDDSYSKPDTYWYYKKSGVVYDFKLHYPVGRVAVDDSGLPKKLDQDTYIMDYVIPIPLVDSV